MWAAYPLQDQTKACTLSCRRRDATENIPLHSPALSEPQAGTEGGAFRAEFQLLSTEAVSTLCGELLASFFFPLFLGAGCSGFPCRHRCRVGVERPFHGYCCHGDCLLHTHLLLPSAGVLFMTIGESSIHGEASRRRGPRSPLRRQHSPDPPIGKPCAASLSLANGLG